MKTYTAAMRMPNGDRLIDHVQADDVDSARLMAHYEQIKRKPFQSPSSILVLIPKEESK